MKIPQRITRFRSFKFAPLTIIGLFLFANLTGVFFSRAFAPSAQARSATLNLDHLPDDVPTSGDHKIDLLIFRAGERHGVDPRLLHHVVWQESKYKADAKSHAGAQGLMQLIPATARRFGCEESCDPASNVEAGTRYLGWLLKRFDGNVALALAAYNAGEGAVDKYNGVPPYNQTQNYVRIIVSRYGKAFHPLLTPEEARVKFGLVREIARLNR